ncbi:TPA: hypothetical protein NHT99_004655, partial [Escherichia coli]|nr:hypothetical protein [Escherichia coli]HCH7882196.1 hypothetical protein [Escherichia coli]
MFYAYDRLRKTVVAH